MKSWSFFLIRLISHVYYSQLINLTAVGQVYPQKIPREPENYLFSDEKQFMLRI
jgi:hypothetical protein